MSDLDYESLMRLRSNVGGKWSYGDANAQHFYEAVFHALPKVIARMLQLSTERDDLVVAAAKLHGAMREKDPRATKEAYRELMKLAKVPTDD